MGISDDSEDYYRLRVAHELELADRAGSSGDRELHLQSAERYRQLADDAALRALRASEGRASV